MAEIIRETTRKGDTLKPGTPSQALSVRNTANAAITAQQIKVPRTWFRNSRYGILKNWPPRRVSFLLNQRLIIRVK